MSDGSFFSVEQTNLLLLLLRVFVAVVILPHGLQKLLGWFGGYGFRGTMAFFTDSMKLPWLVGLAVIVIESAGAVLLLTGLGTRLVAAGLIAVMLGAIFTSHHQHGFFMNWFGGQEGEGYEFHLLVVAIALALVIGGAGAWSLDALLLTTLAG